ncbi:MAG: DUF502 domain-containing protein [Deltaproteobacteria bacterium]|nr:DUF502 domain-containing protein [Deltaproteobacteria bacterium]
MKDENVSEVSKKKTSDHHIQRYIITGALTLIPLWITWLFFHLIFQTLSDIGLPWVKALSHVIEPTFPNSAEWLVSPLFQSSLAVLLTLLVLYILGWIASRVIGKRIWGMIDSIMERIPFAHKIYGATKKLLALLQTPPGGEKINHVVLINFPSERMKTVGILTRLLKDEVTGESLAAVYVPTTPNPTSGYLEILPLADVVPTNWNMEEAMTFIISGGAVAPESITYSRPAVSE